MPRVNNVIQQVSQLNTYEQEKVFDFLKTVLMSNGITNSIDEEIAENRFNKGKCYRWFLGYSPPISIHTMYINIESVFKQIYIPLSNDF